MDNKIVVIAVCLLINNDDSSNSSSEDENENIFSLNTELEILYSILMARNTWRNSSYRKVNRLCGQVLE